MSSFGRNIFSVIAEHASKPVSDSEKGQGDWKLNRYVVSRSRSSSEVANWVVRRSVARPGQCLERACSASCCAMAVEGSREAAR
jgi:hypothetical protein